MTSASAVEPADVLAAAPADVQTLELLEETVSVDKRASLRKRTVRVVTRQREQELRETLTQERVEIERVPIGREVTSVPESRTEGDTTILPVVEERLVVERRLVLVEEVRIRTIRTRQDWNDTASVRYQEVVVSDGAGSELPDSSNVDERA